MGKNVIIACDFSSKEELISFLDKMEGADPNFYCKVGMELFDSCALQGFNIVQIIKSRGHKVFLDLKLKDIPNTVSKTAAVLATAGVDMINVHADGGLKMMQEVKKAVDKVYNGYKEELEKLESDHSYSAEALKDAIKEKIAERPLLLGVTVLTSMSEDVLRNEIGIDKTTADQAKNLALLTKAAGFDGVVCSAEDILTIKEVCGDDFVTVTPGIRFMDSKKDDQDRVTTPACANILGTDYIVVGRAITGAEDSIAAYNKCKHDFTENVTDEVEIANAKDYIKKLKEKIKSPSDIVAQKLLDAKSFIINTEDPFLLKSGVAAPIYMNNRDLYKCPKEQRIVMDYLADLIRTCYPNAEAIFGTPMSAILFGGLVAERLGLPVGFVRKEAKDHGLKTTIEGPNDKGLKVVQIEDLITTGESSLEFIHPLQDAGIDVLGVAAIVDNDFVESEKLIEAGIEYQAITTGTKIAEYAAQAGIIAPSDIDKILVYKNNARDESWMSEKAKENIAAKRLARLNEQNK